MWEGGKKVIYSCFKRFVSYVYSFGGETDSERYRKGRKNVVWVRKETVLTDTYERGKAWEGKGFIRLDWERMKIERQRK